MRAEAFKSGEALLHGGEPAGLSVGRAHQDRIHVLFDKALGQTPTQKSACSKNDVPNHEYPVLACGLHASFRNALENEAADLINQSLTAKPIACLHSNVQAGSSAAPVVLLPVRQCAWA